MKNEFKEYYSKSNEQILEILENGIFIFDTNVLLNLYRYSNSTRKDWLEALNKLKEKIHLPYIIGLEFHKNRNGVMIDENLNNQKDNELLSKLFSEFEQKVLTKSKYSDNYKEIKQQLDNLENKVKATQNEHPDFTEEDFVIDQLLQVFNNSVGVPYSEKEINDLIEDAKIRFEEKIPPGYMDLADKKEINKDGTGIYGDYIVWKSIIDFSKKEKKPIIFVTNDTKEDWWWKVRGRTISPRVELLREFYKETSQEYLQYLPDQFLKFIKDNISNKISDQSIEETEVLTTKDFYNKYHKSINIKLNDEEKVNEDLIQWLYSYNFNKEKSEKDWNEKVRKMLIKQQPDLEQSEHFKEEFKIRLNDYLKEKDYSDIVKKRRRFRERRLLNLSDDTALGMCPFCYTSNVYNSEEELPIICPNCDERID